MAALLALLAGLAAAGQWQSLFDGKSLKGWQEAAFAKHPAVRVQDGAIVLEAGSPLTGINRPDFLLKSDYEVRFEATRIRGNDFFASLTFPVGDSFGTWVLGGWGGDIVGFSSIDGWDASDNETRSYFTFENNRWYSFRLRVTVDRLQAWIDEKSVFDVDITGRTVSLRRGDIKLSTPFGFASYLTTGSVRKIELRSL